MNKYKYCGIYKIKIDKYEYVGQSKNILSRIAQHKKKLKYDIHPNKYLQNVYNKYNNFEYSILWKGEEVYLTILEQTFINMSKNNLNLAPAGKSYNKNKEQRKSLSEAMKSSEKVKAVLAKIHSRPKSIKQREASKQSVKSMNTKKANAKSAKSRINNQTVLNSVRNRKGTDKKIYSFLNTNTGQLFTGLRSEFGYEFKINSARIFDLIKRSKYKSWIVLDHCPFKTP